MPQLLLKYVLIAAMAVGFAQTYAQSLAQYVTAGNKELNAGYPKSALEYYQLALKLDTHFTSANMGAANAYKALRNYRRAEAHYREVVENDGEDEYLEANLYQALMLMQLGKYQNAKPSVQYFLSAYRQRDDLYKYARSIESNCDWALEHKDDTVKFEISNPDSGLNTIHAEMSPFIWDSNTIYFSTMRYENDVVRKSKSVNIEIKKAVKDSNIWVEAELDLPISDKKAHVGNGTFSSDSSKFYFTKCDELTECEIYVTKRQNGNWSAPESLPSPVNEKGSTNTQPTSVTYDGIEYLFFASNREGGKGNMDIWSVEVRNNVPMKLKNLGTRVNTAGDEITPWFDEADTVLYYSSNLANGFGGFDIFRSKGLPGTFNLVENLGPEINSSADDFYFNYFEKDSTGYFSSNRKNGIKADGNETCCNDLYKVKRLPTIILEVLDTLDTDTTEAVAITDSAQTGEVVMVDTNENLPAISVPVDMRALQEALPIKMFYHNDSPDPRTTSRTTKTTYLEAFNGYLARKNEYLDAVEEADLSSIEKAEYEEKMTEFFDKELRTSIGHLNAALDILARQLKAGKSIQLVIKGYASPLANSNYNLNLTYRRIDAIINYFEQYNDGILKPFINNGQLVLDALPYGESKASNTVSDLVKDKLGAIYGSKAAFERRIEIQSIEQVD
jgi:tetratricopeptide (TPR) repeat protein